MKKTLMLLVFVLGLTIACEVTMQSIKPGVTLDTIMKVVDTLQSDQDGWKILSIPDKNFKVNHIEFIFLKMPNGDWGIGVTNGSEAVCQIYSVKTNQWYFNQYGMSMPMDEKTAQESLNEFMRLLAENGDFSGVKPFKPEIPKQEI